VQSPRAEVVVDEELVRALLEAQHPDLASLPLEFFAEGWDNAIWRLGVDLLVRLPRRELAAPLARTELRWLSRLAGTLPLPVPAPVRAGVPGCGYPWPWSVVPLLHGNKASELVPLTSPSAAAGLAGFLRALHQPAPRDAPHNPYRSVPLEARDDAFRQRVALLGADIEARAQPWWELACAAPPSPAPATWVHGDLHPGNVLVDAGALCGVVDFGDLCAGDPAVDLSSAWLLFEQPLATDVLAAYGADDPSLAHRARGWALLFSVMFASISDDANAVGRSAGLASLLRLLEEPAP
jgi:aminoglycoside phosphotransferase (APT) family kinase protein